MFEEQRLDEAHEVVARRSREDTAARADGWCCAADRRDGPCSHLRQLAREFVAEEAQHRARRVERDGLAGLLDAADMGDPEARCLVLELVPLAALPSLSWLPPATDPSTPPRGPDDDGPDPESLTPDAWPPDAGRGLGVPPGSFAAMSPGPGLAAVVSAVDISELDRFAQIELLAACKRIEAWAAARGAEVAGLLSDQAEVFGRSPKDRVDCTAEEIAMRLAVTRTEARTLVCVGRGMRRTFQETASALRGGRIDFAKARTIITRLSDSATEVAWLTEQEVLPNAHGRTKGQLDRDISRALISVDPLDAKARHARARARRHVNHTRPLPDGMGGLYAVLPAEECVRVDLALDAIAQAANADGDTRTTDQLRADALSALAQGALLLGHTGSPEDAGIVATTAAPRMPSGASPGAASPVAAPPDAAPPTVAPPVAPPPPVSADPWRKVTPSAPFDDSDGDEPAQGAEPPGPEPGARDLLRWMLGTRPPMRVGDPRTNRTQVHVSVPVSVLVTECGIATPTSPTAGTVTADSSATWTSSISSTVFGNPPAAVDEEPAEVATLAGYGPITPDIAVRLAAEGTWRRILTDPATGVVLDIGRTRYQPPKELAALVRARDGTCVRPGCTTPAARCQLDHTDSWASGGRTSAANLGDLCTRDHQTKTAGAFEVTQPSPGTFVWRTPSGHVYVRGPDGTIRMGSRRRRN